MLIAKTFYIDTNINDSEREKRVQIQISKFEKQLNAKLITFSHAIGKEYSPSSHCEMYRNYISIWAIFRKEKTKE